MSRVRSEQWGIEGDQPGVGQPVIGKGASDEEGVNC